MRNRRRGRSGGRPVASATPRPLLILSAVVASSFCTCTYRSGVTILGNVPSAFTFKASGGALTATGGVPSTNTWVAVLNRGPANGETITVYYNRPPGNVRIGSGSSVVYAKRQTIIATNTN